MAISRPPARQRVTPAALVTRGALVAYLTPRLAQDERRNSARIAANAVRGLTSRNFNNARPHIVKSVSMACDGRLAFDADVSDLAALLQALKPEVEQADQAPGLGQIATNPGGSAGPMPPSDGESEDIVAKIKAYLEQEGVAPEILNNLDAFLAQHTPNAGAGNPPGPDAARLLQQRGGMDRMLPSKQQGQDQENGENIEGGGPEDLEPRGSVDDTEFKPESASDAEPIDAMEYREEGEDEEVPSEQPEQMGGVPEASSSGAGSRVMGSNSNGRAEDRRMVTKGAMDQAIRIAQDAVIKNQRQIREAERYVRPWVGDISLAMDANSPADVYRATLRALGVKGFDKVHPDALRPILDAQPKPSVARAAHVQQQARLAQDSKPAQGNMLDRFPDAGKITIQ